MRGLEKKYRHEHLNYELYITPSGSILFGLTGGANSLWAPEPDPFGYPGDSNEIFITDDVGALRNPVPLLRQVLRDIQNWIGGQRPYYFRFSATTDKKLCLYRRVAKVLIRRFNYYLVEDGHRFHFYRMS